MPIVSKLYRVSYAPHKTSPYTSKNIMQDVAIALTPAGLFGIYNFGLRALLIILVSVTACVATEYIYLRATKKAVTPSDYSAVVTGMLLAYTLPVNIPLWIPAFGGGFAILVVKMLYGGLGKNFMNPALAARCFLLISFPTIMVDYGVEKLGNGEGLLSRLHSGTFALDAVSSATPLEAARAGERFELMKMFTGHINGTIGEVSALALLIGAIFLLGRKIISIRIPLTYLATFSAFIAIFGGDHVSLNFVLGHVLGGGLFLAAFFMATDYATSPDTVMGQVVYGVILGLLTGVFRVLGASTEGVAYAIIIVNLLTPLIEKVTVPKPFGKEKARNGR